MSKKKNRGRHRASAMSTATRSVRVVIYLRTASAEQETDVGIQWQRQACLAKARELGATALKEYVDAGQSAVSMHRPQLRLLLQELPSLNADFVLIYNLSRLTRNQRHYASLSEVIAQAGGKLIVVSESGSCFWCGAELDPGK